MAYSVVLTDDAARDLVEFYEYIRVHDCPASADHVLDAIEETLAGLAEMPSRGAYPPELSAVGIQEYREVFFKPYRIICRVHGKKVYVMVIAAGRRDMRTLLERRLLAP